MFINDLLHANLLILSELNIIFSVIVRQVMAVNIQPGTFVLGFEAYADFGQTSTSMAIDDVRLLNGNCLSQGKNQNT